MTPEDLKQLALSRPHLLHFPRIGQLSPCPPERKLFPKAKVLRLKDWDLNQRSASRFDLLIACNVFMYGQQPRVWLDNALASCRFLLLLEPIRRRRSPHAELGSDGDACRFSVASHAAAIPNTFALETLGQRLLGQRVFPGGDNEYGPSLHVLALISGDWQAPLLRIDDYPTGVRPILDDLEPLHGILRYVDDQALRFHLGIVPALLDEKMIAFLRSLQHLVPCVHGFDHGYPSKSKILREQNDLANQRSTIRDFNEFSGQDQATVTHKLGQARIRLEHALQTEVTGYIPPCNRGDRRVGKALVETGYTYYLSERPIPGCRLPRIGSDFYGLSSEYALDTPAEVITLHVTWEQDLARREGLFHLQRLVQHLTVKKTQAQGEAQELARTLFGTEAPRP